MTSRIAPLLLAVGVTACAKSEAGDMSASRIAAALEGKSKSFPDDLAETQLFLDTAGKTPATSLVPYEVKVPLWSDGAQKKRFIFVPPGRTVAVDPVTYELTFPVGTTLVKYFAAATAPDVTVETRVITKKDDGLWHFATYVWDATKGKSALNKNPRKVPGPDGEYRVPSESECKTCHGNGTKILGFRLAQLNFQSSTDKAGTNQLQRLSEAIRFDQPPELMRKALALDDINDESLPLLTRARSYMNVNCSPCHNPDGPDKANKIDFRLGITDTHVVAEGKLIPGDRPNSILWQKITAVGQDRMPPLTLRPDPAAVDLLGRAVDVWPEH